MKKLLTRFLFCLAPVFILACNPLKKIPEGSWFLDKNKIDSDTLHFNKEELNSLLKQKTNRKILGILRLHLGIYHLGNTGDTAVAGSKWFSKLWKKTKRGMRQIGEEPIILDSVLTKKSREQLEIFLQRKGFFNAIVTDSTRIKKKRATVYYSMKPGRPYNIRNIDYASPDKHLEELALTKKKSSLINPGKVYDEADLDKERDRLTSEIRDHGYYFFNRNYITYEIDSSLNSRQVDVYLFINRQNENAQTGEIAGEQENHHRYRLDNIYIYTNFDSRKEGISGDTSFLNNYYFITDLKKDYITKEALLKFIFIKKGDLFYQKDVDYTYTRLADLGIFKFINFRFREVPRDSNQQEYLLDVILQLSTHAKQEYKLESEATNNGGNLGIAGSLSYENKNLLRGAESFEVKMRVGLEHLRNVQSESERNSLFNTFDFGPEVNLRFKKFLLPPFIEKGTSKRFNPKTTLSIGTNYQDRPDYNRIISKLAFGYQWRVSATQRMQYYPFEINSVNVVINDEQFREKIEKSFDQALKYSYSSHLITSSRFGWTMSNQVKRPGRSFYFLRTNLETAGNTLRLYSQLFESKIDQDENNRYTVFDNAYYQYIKPELDFIFHHRLNQSNTLVYRLTGGIGITYGNSEGLILPFDKAFFASGANDIRAWLARDLGPGCFKSENDSLLFESSGDIKMEANIEYRASIFKILETAVFADAGNVWVRKDRSGTFDEGGIFYSNRFINQIAIGAGVGIRFNFTFFIIRVDFGVKVRDPVDFPYSWFYGPDKYDIRGVVTNLAIGYPF